MNNRIAKKVLTQVSSLHLNENSVNRARMQVAKDPNYFKAKSIYLWPPMYDHVEYDSVKSRLT